MYKYLSLALLLFASVCFAQKKPLNHSVYDTWEAISFKRLSNNGEWAGYGVSQQQGDATLYLSNLVTNARLKVNRAENLQFSPDSKYAAFSIKSFYANTRAAKIKKKKADEMIKDTLGIVSLANLSVVKVPRVKNYKFPEKAGAYLAYQLEKPLDTTKKNGTDQGTKKDTQEDADKSTTGFADEDADKKDQKEGSDLIFRNLLTGVERTFKYVSEYTFSKDGKQLIFAATGAKKDATAKAGVFLLNIEKGSIKTLVNGKGDFKSFLFDEEGESLVFLGEQSPEKQEVKDYFIYFNSPSLDTAQILVDSEINGMPKKWSVSGDGALKFNKEGTKLFFGIAPVKTPKDTTLVDFENAKLDIWGYKDDYLQPMQLKNAEKEVKRSYLTAIEIFNADAKVVPLTDLKLPDATLIDEGNSSYVLTSTDYGNRIQEQWSGNTIKDYYLVDIKTGVRKKIITGLAGFAAPSPSGKYVLYFDKKAGNWYTYNILTSRVTQVNAGIPVKITDELNDVPDEPDAYGIAGWTEDDKSVLIYDRYDIWDCSPDGKIAPKNITNGFGLQNKITFRYNKLDPEQRFLEKKAVVLLDAFNNITKEHGFYSTNIGDSKNPELLVMAKFNYSDLVKAKDAERYIYDKGNYTSSPNVYTSADMKVEVKLSNTNPQQQSFNWGTAELVKWSTPKGYNAEGILYKPEDFDPAKKYPVIVYFYEKLSDGLYNYVPPAPTPSRLNISYFVSNGYLVFAPDISYEKGYPGRSAEEFINSGVRSLTKNSWADSTKVGLQGQSWGGYQVAHLITRTNMYAAAWAGAPVVNMTSAYGGMRWESGLNRQFQYEKTQSRIGATLWEKPELYIENSPLFSLPKVNTPVVIMSNDADGAVPWYQGLEMFNGLRRLGKPVWLLNYNNEAHNLIQRQNRKDIQIREQQFFDYYLKGAKAPVWMVGGIPATEKGRTWGFDLTDEKP
ncbi:MAG TPA: prolyl oligopeptidase family serine peptidase [Pedobacter sp.]|nr:prolyl oligopeptidase family serine peptidase [Pedobacter sp.]